MNPYGKLYSFGINLLQGRPLTPLSVAQYVLSNLIFYYAVMSYLPPHQIQKIYKIKDIQERIQLIEANSEISDDEKNQILTTLHKRLEEIRTDKRKRYEERKKEYTEYKIYANTKQNAFLKE